MTNRYANKGDFMPLKDCPCLNMITATIDFYKRQPKRLMKIHLNPIHWNMLNRELMKVLKEDYEPKDVISFEGSPVEITLSRLQERAMRYEFKMLSEFMKDDINKAVC
jgi:hypothetical protein